MASKRGAPKKNAVTKKAAVAQIRLNRAEKAGFEDAAQLSGLSLSAWMRERLRVAAKAELAEHGHTAPFLVVKKSS